MATTQRIQVAGLRELGEKFRRLGTLTNAQGVAQKAVNAGGLVIKKRVIANAPVAPAPYRVDDGTKSGQLVQPRNIQRNVVVKKVPQSQTQYTAEAVVAIRGKRKNGFASRIASLAEFGTVKQAAKPFVRPAFEEGKFEAVDAIALRLQQELDKVTR